MKVVPEEIRVHPEVFLLFPIGFPVIFYPVVEIKHSGSKGGPRVWSRSLPKRDLPGCMLFFTP